MAILYSFRRCPYAMRARMALQVSGVPVEIREVVLRDKPAAMLLASPKGTVPVLVLPDGRVIDQSLAIMRWALERHDPEEWLRDAYAVLIAANDDGFKHHLDRYKYAERYGSDAGEHARAGVAWLGTLERRLATQPCLGGERRTLADVAIFPFVRQFAATDTAFFAAQPLPAVRRWLAEQIASPLFEQAMQRRPVWRGDAEPA